MPSFLSKVFGRKKDDRGLSPTGLLGQEELLGGKFEAVSPNVSPSAHYLELQSDAAKLPAPETDDSNFNGEKDYGVPFFRIKSRPSSSEFKPKKLFNTLPPLSLDFDDLKDKSAYNGYIFEESNPEAILPDNVLGQRRLNPVEALVLIRACSQAIISRGLETLGIMTPHWYSASPDVQRRLISKFLRSLELTSSTTTTTTASSPYLTNFEDEVHFTRSIHDVAAVFRWGLRHVQLEGDSFGTDDGWYKAFLNAEATNDYPPKAFSEKLGPTLPISHFNLLTSTLEVFSSLAAFSESNSTSGSKLSKIFGLWLLTARRVEDKDDWRTFYARWERTGRMLEHLFLARIRDQSTDQRMPTRLLDLVRKYPYTHGLSSPTTDLQLIPYPQFATALHPALFVRIQYEVTSQERIPKTKINPSTLVADAFSTKVEEGEFIELWTKITNAASKIGTELPLGNVFAGESLRLLSLGADKPQAVKSTTFNLVSMIKSSHQRSSSSGAASVSAIKPSTDSAITSPLSPVNIGSDWEQFSTSGFLEVDQTLPPLASTLFDTDVEKTEPRNIPLPISRKSSKRAGRKSPHFATYAESTGESSPEVSHSKSSSKGHSEAITVSHLEVIDLDEAFFDFWSDTFLDPIASDWPTFVICKFKPSLVPDLTFGTGDETTEKTLKWLVLEQVYSVKPRPVSSSASPLTPLPATMETPAVRLASPIAQTPTGRRLFNFWSLSRTPSTSSTGSQKAKKILKTPKIGEMGELIEEEGDRKELVQTKSPISKTFKSLNLSSIKKSFGESENLEKAMAVDATGPKTSVSVASPTIAGADAAGSVVVAVTAAVGLGAVKDDVVKKLDISTSLEPVAESSEPILLTETVDYPSKRNIAPAEVDTPTIHAEQETHIIDAVITSVTGANIIADKQQIEEPLKGEGSPIGEMNHNQEVGLPLLMSAASTSVEPSSNQPLLPEAALLVQQNVEVEQTIGSPEIADKPQETVVSEERQAPVLTGEDEISEATGKGRENEKLEGREDPPKVSLTEVATTTAVCPLPDVEVQVTESNLKISEPIEANVEESVLPVEVKSEAGDVLPVGDEVPKTDVERIGSEYETSVTTSSGLGLTVVDEPIVIQEAPVIETYSEQDEMGSSMEEAAKSVAVTPTHTSTPVVHIAEDLPVTPGIVVPLTDQSLEVEAVPGAIVEDSLADPVIQTISEENGAGTSVEPLIKEYRVPEPPVDTSVGEPESMMKIQLQELSISETQRSQETTVDLFATEPAGIVEKSSAVEFEVEESTDTVEGALVDEQDPIHGQKALIVEPEAAVEAPVDDSVSTKIPETATVDEEPPEEPLINVSRETLATQDASSSIDVLKSSIAVESEPEATLEPVIKTGLPAPEAMPAAEELEQELPAFKESPINPESDKTLSAESQFLTEDSHEEPRAIETQLSEKRFSAEPELPIEEPGITLEDLPTEVLQEPNAAPLGEKAEAVPDPEVVSHVSEFPAAGEASTPEVETLLNAEHGKGPSEPTLLTVEDARVEGTPVHKPLAFPEVTPPPEEISLTGVTSEETRIAEEAIVVPEGVGADADVPERTAEIIADSDAAIPEITSASIREVSREAPVIAPNLNPEISISSVIAEPAHGEVPEQAQAVAEASASPDISKGVEDAATVTEPSVPSEELFKVSESVDVAKEAPVVAVGQPNLPSDVAPERLKDVSVDKNISPAVVEAVTREPLATESSPLVQELPASVEDTTEKSLILLEEPDDNATAIEKPSTLEQSILTATEENKLPEVSMHFEESPRSRNEEDVFSQIDEVTREELSIETPTAPAEESSVPQPEAEADLKPLPFGKLDREDHTSTSSGPEALGADNDSPIHSQEVGHSALGGNIEEPIVAKSAAGDALPVEESNEHNAPIPSSTPKEASEEEPTPTDYRNEEANTLSTIAGAASTDEKKPTETPPTIIELPTVAELDVDPVSLAESSPGSYGSAIPKQSEHIPEHIDVALIDTKQPEEEVSTSVEKSLEGTESASELLSDTLAAPSNDGDPEKHETGDDSSGN